MDCVYGTFCLCTLSASASLHQLDFFLEIFLSGSKRTALSRALPTSTYWRASGIEMCVSRYLHSVPCQSVAVCSLLYTVWSGEGDLTVYTVSGKLCLQFSTSDGLLQCSDVGWKCLEVLETPLVKISVNNLLITCIVL